MKLTLENENGVYVIQEKDEKYLSEMLDIFERLLVAAGYSLPGALEFREKESN